MKTPMTALALFAALLTPPWDHAVDSDRYLHLKP